MRVWSWVDFPKGAVVSAFAAALVFAAIWVPELAHWYVKPEFPSLAAVDLARKQPQQSTLDEVAAMPLGAVAIAPQLVVSAAEQVLRGTLNLPGFPPMPLALPFAPEDLERGVPAFQLAVASLVSADILLEAYRMTGREVFFRQAGEIITAFARHEAKQWFDQGLMWNDHAIAARTPVLVKFWAYYRIHPAFDPAVGQLVLNLVSRSAELLAKPSFYAWRTGHGIVSNVALLQMAVAFPEMPDVSTIRGVASERFNRHLTYWINEEGVTLLHSAGYHSPGLFAVVLRLYTLNGLAIPGDWWSRYAKAIEFDVQLRRPDNTLPMFGDTMSTPRELGMMTVRDRDDTAGPLRARTPGVVAELFASYPVAGHAVWWDGLAGSQPSHASAAQTVMTWSHHPGLGHKLADELSMVLWAGGRTWLTNTGYWPYGVAGREHAESWGASNAPHLLGEAKDSARKSRLLGQGQGSGISFVDLERVGPSGYTVRRQVVRLARHRSWVVLDHSLDSAAQRTATHWTLYPDVAVTPLVADGRYQVTAPDSPWGMQLSFAGSPGHKTALALGQKSPFAGWVVMDRTPTPAPSIVVTQGSQDSWSLASLTLTDKVHDSDPLPALRMVRWINPDQWSANVPTPAGEVMLTREDNRVMAHPVNSAANADEIELALPLMPVAELQAVREGMHWAADNYQKFRELISYRLEATVLLLIVLICQEIIFFFMRYRLGPVVRAARVGSWLVWAMGGVWLSQVYLTVPH